MSDDEMDPTLDIENGLHSFNNPNYNLIDNNDVNDDYENELDSEESDLGDSLYQEIETSPVCRLNRKPSVRNRRNYAQLNIGSMGVDLNSDPLTNIEQSPLLIKNSSSSITTTTTTTTTSTTTSSSPNTTTDESEVELINSCKNQSSSPVPDAENNLKQDTSVNNPLEAVNNNELTEDMVRRKNNKYTNNTSTDELDSSCHELKIRDELCRSFTDMAMTPDSCCSSNSTSVTVITDGIPHIAGQMNNDLYAVPVKCKQLSLDASEKPSKFSAIDENSLSPVHAFNTSNSSNKSPQSSIDHSSGEISEDELLPQGWEKHEDIDGPYFWHIKSGTIQREPPRLPLSISQQDMRQLTQIPASKQGQPQLNSPSVPTAATPTHTETSFDELVKKRHSCPPSSMAAIQTSEKGTKCIRFAVRSLGWVEIAEEDLTPDRSSKAVNKCIVDLSHGRNDKLDAIGRWGDGKDLFMDLDDSSLKLVSPSEMKVLNTQPIPTIRVWGVGRDNGRDFAYVARDRVSRKHMCHVFRCDSPARIIANTLRDICKKIMIERSLVQNLARPVDTGPGKKEDISQPKFAGIHHSFLSGKGRNSNGPTRPNNLPVDHKIGDPRSLFPASRSFPTPMEEPKKVLKAYYMGSEIVQKPSGMDVLNEAIDRCSNSLPPDKWQQVNVSVAPSTISVQEIGENGKLLAECRVRFLSFLGIGKNSKTCAFIMQNAQDEFIAYVFHCEPSSGALCKTIEAACKLRYQKCLDSHHPQNVSRNSSGAETKGIGNTIRNMLGSLAGRKSKSMDS